MSPTRPSGDAPLKPSWMGCSAQVRMEESSCTSVSPACSFGGSTSSYPASRVSHGDGAQGDGDSHRALVPDPPVAVHPPAAIRAVRVGRALRYVVPANKSGEWVHTSSLRAKVRAYQRTSAPSHGYPLRLHGWPLPPLETVQSPRTMIAAMPMQRPALPARRSGPQKHPEASGSVRCENARCQEGIGSRTRERVGGSSFVTGRVYGLQGTRETERWVRQSGFRRGGGAEVWACTVPVGGLAVWDCVRGVAGPPTFHQKA